MFGPIPGFFKDQINLCDNTTSTSVHTATSFAKTVNGCCVGGGVMVRVPLTTNFGNNYSF